MMCDPKEKPLPDKKRPCRRALTSLLIFPAENRQEGVSTLGKSGLLWRHRARPSATLDKNILQLSSRIVGNWDGLSMFAVRRLLAWIVVALVEQELSIDVLRVA